MNYILNIHVYIYFGFSIKINIKIQGVLCKDRNISVDMHNIKLQF